MKTKKFQGFDYLKSCGFDWHTRVQIEYKNPNKFQNLKSTNFRKFGDMSNFVTIHKILEKTITAELWTRY